MFRHLKGDASSYTVRLPKIHLARGEHKDQCLPGSFQKHLSFPRPARVLSKLWQKVG